MSVPFPKENNKYLINLVILEHLSKQGWAERRSKKTEQKSWIRLIEYRQIFPYRPGNGLPFVSWTTFWIFLCRAFARIRKKILGEGFVIFVDVIFSYFWAERELLTFAFRFFFDIWPQFKSIRGSSHTKERKEWPKKKVISLKFDPL